MSDISSDPESEGQGPVKSFLEHIEDVRWLLFKLLITITVAWVLCFAYRTEILGFLSEPLRRSGIENTQGFLKIPSPGAPFTIAFQIALYAGMVVSGPALIYFLAAYILPALTSKERGYIRIAFWLGSLLFLAGVFFCYFVMLPMFLKVSREWSEELGSKVEFYFLDDYVSFVCHFMLATGVSFELPLVILVLVRAGVLSHSILARSRRYAVIIIVIVSAVLTPTSDVLSLLLMSGPLIVMYEACIWIAWFMEWQEKRSAISS